MTDIAEKAAGIVEALRETDAETESLRRVSDEAVALMHGAGLSLIEAPAAYGGYQLSPRDLIEAERLVAHASPAASWVLMVCQAHTFIAGRLPEQGQAEVFDAFADVAGDDEPVGGVVAERGQGFAVPPMREVEVADRVELHAAGPCVMAASRPGTAPSRPTDRGRAPRPRPRPGVGPRSAGGETPSACPCLGATRGRRLGAARRA